MQMSTYQTNYFQMCVHPNLNFRVSIPPH